MKKKRNSRNNKNTKLAVTEEKKVLDEASSETDSTVDVVSDENITEEAVVDTSDPSFDSEEYLQSDELEADTVTGSLDEQYSSGIEAYDDTLQYTEGESEKVVFESVKGDDDEEYGFDKKKKSGKENKESFLDFVKETGSKLSRHIKNNKKIYSVAGACFVMVLVIVIITIIIGNIKRANNDKTRDVDSLGVSTSNVTDITEEPFEENAYPEINKLFEDYFKYFQNNDIDSLLTVRDYIDNVSKAKIEVKSKYIESYSNINCYTKKGPIENSFVCFVSYDVKVKDYDVLAPSLLAFLVCTNDEGKYYIYCSKFSQEMSDYTNKIVEQSDVKELISRVNTQYNNVLAENPEYSEYMVALNQIIKDEVGELLASQINEQQTVSDNSISENSVSENEAESTDSDINKVKVLEVKTKTTVNVRASDSEQADRLGKVTEGTVLTCNKQMDNGWSQIIYEGKVGYIKTEFLEVIGNSTNENLAVTTDTVTVKETVKIRKSPSTDAESLGVAYAGETFPSVEKLKNGWTKIIYDNKEAYIKTEFLEKN